MTRYILPLLTTALVSGFGAATPVLAQNLFAPHVIVNGSAVTEWELAQRRQFLTLLRAPGDIGQQAEDGLIEDRLRLDAAKQMGITASDEEVQQGMEEFAQRANLSADQFITQIESAGVDRTTFRDFVRAGVVWRGVIRQKYASSVVISDADIDRAIEAQKQAPNVRVLLSEMILPVPPGQENQALNAAEDIARRVQAGESFAEFARQYSATPSRENGGALEWMPLSDLPPPLQSVFLNLRPGGVTQPLQIPNAVALFQLRDRQETAPTKRPTEVEIARYPLPADNPTGAAAQIIGRVDGCNDLYSAARRDGVAVQRETRSEAGLPAELATAVAGLDQNETAVVTVGGQPTLLMVCARRPIAEEAVNRDEVRGELLNQQLNARAAVYLSQLRDDALIRTP
ncbi:peptidylprolyl isomerase [Falsirhodobacter sp. 20TX0035]|uniref:peptidylprolyl isomerase n=1 Tax=Falsirhodobacter sp. 20TX0035 TaxID=3022019 RepID=UPI00232CBE01|nr:peptidylprolyl isomerase [Falsirhodobacter sp. 20TX0035]MDB6453138.1 peptidylprolyl isomerase [Falsirhodobacter sp. 20TX0035]